LLFFSNLFIKIFLDNVNGVCQSLPLHNLDPNIGTSCTLQQVSTIATHKYVIAWMLDDESLHVLEAFVHA